MWGHRPKPGEWLIRNRMLDEAADAAMKSVKIVRTYDVPYVGSCNRKGDKVYIDYELPKTLTHRRQALQHRSLHRHARSRRDAVRACAEISVSRCAPDRAARRTRAGPVRRAAVAGLQPLLRALDQAHRRAQALSESVRRTSI